MADGRVFFFSQVPPHPRDAFTPDNVIDVNHRLQRWKGRDMSTNHNDRCQGKLAYQSAHFLDLTEIHNDRGDADDVVVMLS
jgi:hypothetical protein